MFYATLRFKFLLSLALISALLTTVSLLVVRQRVEVRVREEIAEGLKNSVTGFQHLQAERERMFERSAALLATLPPLKAVMASQHAVTIQDASKTFWKLVDSQLFVLADSQGNLLALHTASPGFGGREAHSSIARSLAQNRTRDWWFGNGRLFEVFLQTIYFGSQEDNTVMGVLAIGYEIDNSVAADVARVASGQVAFRHGSNLVATTAPAKQTTALAANLEKLTEGDAQIDLAGERYIAASVRLSPSETEAVSLTVLKSYDEATAFLSVLNRWLVVVGFAAIVLGSALVFLVSTTFTRPLGELVKGVRALETGDFNYPLSESGSDEISVLTAAFNRMRGRLQESQHRVIEAERLATIGRMASMISHDLRHPLTAILAYAEFLSESNLSSDQRKDFYQEIRIGVNRMMDEINSLLGFSRQHEKVKPVYARVDDVIRHAIETVKILPEYQDVRIDFRHCDVCKGWFDPGKLERVILNLLFNACEAVPAETGHIEVNCERSSSGFRIRVSDNGPGVPDAIRENLFQPFVSHGKEKGIGLGLTVVQKIVQDHGGAVELESSGPKGTVFSVEVPELNGDLLKVQ